MPCVRPVARSSAFLIFLRPDLGLTSTDAKGAAHSVRQGERPRERSRTSTAKIA